MGYLEKMQELGFLGGEFLTWIAVEAARGRGPENWGNCDAAALTIPGPILMEGPGVGAEKVAVTGGDLMESPEFRSALAEGKHVRRIKMQVVIDDDAWTGTLDSTNLEWRSLKLPVVPTPNTDEFIFLRVQALERIHSLTEQWFAAFLTRRTDKNRWKKHVEDFRLFASE